MRKKKKAFGTHAFQAFDTNVIVQEHTTKKWTEKKHRDKTVGKGL